MGRYPYQTIASTSLLGLALALPGTGVAQGRQLEEVVVTAQKRAENSQDVPVALTAIDAEMMDQLGITKTSDLVRLAPSLTVGRGENRQNSAFRLRGIGTNVFSVGIEQSVAFIIDDVATVQAGQSIANLIDIERIELLRGPQSTLFGKSASAGVVIVNTKAPSEEFEGSVELTATDDEEQRVEGSVSGPVTDTLGYRVTAYWSDYDGFIDNIASGDTVSGAETKGTRGKLRWDITEQVQADFTAYYSEDDSTCCAFVWGELDPDAKLFGVVPDPVAPGITPSDSNLEMRADNGPEDHGNNAGGVARFAINPGNDFSLLSITAYDDWQYKNDGDVDWSTVDAGGYYTQGAIHGGLYSKSDTQTEFVSQEFRLTSPEYDKYDYLIGTYYANADTTRGFVRNRGLPVLVSDWDSKNATESYAVFGQGTWRFTDKTSVIGGLRWNNEDISVDFLDNVPIPATRFKNNDSDSVVVGNIALQHFFEEDVMTYARYARGYKGQAYDISSGFNQLKADNPVQPETSNAYEIGMKSEWLDRQLQLNTTVFYTEYDDYQDQSTRIFPDGSFALTVNNVGKLTTQGVELEGVALVGEATTLTFGAAYVDATIDEFPNANCYTGQTEAQGCIDGVQDLAGADLPNSPTWKYSLVADYQHALGDLPFAGFLNASYVWQDDINFSQSQDPRTAFGSYGVVNLRIGINDKASDRYRVTAFVNNLLDENYLSGIAPLDPLFGNTVATAYIYSRESQRYYGIELKFNF